MHHQQGRLHQVLLQLLQVEIGLFPVPQPGGIEDEHVPCPAGVLPVVVGIQAAADGLLGSLRQARGFLRVNEPQGIQADQVTHVPVLGILLRIIVRPLGNHPVRDADVRQMREHLLHLCPPGRMLIR